MIKRKTIYRISLLVCTSGILVCGGLFLQQWWEYRTGEKAYHALMETMTAVPLSVDSADLEDSEPFQEQTESIPQVDFGALQQLNPDVVGWLYAPDTVISYPVVQGSDNTYYLNHLFDGTQNSAGCLFLDSGCQGMEGNNSVIYGHHMKNGTLFASLENYRDQDYYDAHPCMYLIMPEQTLTLVLFSAYVTGEEGEAWQLTFSSQEEYGMWQERIRERSCFESEVIPQATERVVTLSTCDYTFQGARFVCHGLVRED